LTDDVMQSARKKISDQFEEIYSRNNVPLSPDAVRRLAGLESSLAKRLTRDEAQVLRNQLDDILQEAGDSGAITGQKYQALRSQIMKAEGGDRIGSAVKTLRQAFDDIAAEAVGPQDAAALKVIRGQWANLRTAENLLKQVPGAGGDIKPSAVWPAIRKGSTKEMRSLGRVGQVLLKDPIPDSGTAGRLLSMGTLAGGSVGGLPTVASLAGLIGTGATVGRIANSKGLANFMLRDGAGQTRQLIAPQLNKLGLPAATLASPNVQRKNRNKNTNKRP